jgi:hypothetical protein
LPGPKASFAAPVGCRSQHGVMFLQKLKKPQYCGLLSWSPAWNWQNPRVHGHTGRERS